MARRRAKIATRQEQKRQHNLSRLKLKIKEQARLSRDGKAAAKASNAQWSMETYEADLHGRYHAYHPNNIGWASLDDASSNRIRKLLKKDWYPKKPFESPLELLASVMREEEQCDIN